MLPGPVYIYECPNCGNLLQKYSFISGNTFGAKMYSDGKCIAPMLPKRLILTKCKKCNNIFWLNKIKEIGTVEFDDYKNPMRQNSDLIESLKIDDCFKAIDTGIAENEQEEFFIRQLIWRSYNNRVRKGENQFIDADDEIMWRENCYKLISLLDSSDLDQRIMIAELKRNLGDYYGCIDILNTIDDIGLNWIKEKLIHECKIKNKNVIKLD